MIIAGMMHFRPEEEAEKIMAPLLALGPLQQIKKRVPWGNITDGGDAVAAHGGLKSFISCGLKEFDGKKFEKTLDLWNKLEKDVPDTNGCVFMHLWFSTEIAQRLPAESSAWSHRDIGAWRYGITVQ